MPIYRNPETGHTVEVMEGTRLPKAYVKVKKTSKPADTAKAKSDDKPGVKDASKKSDKKPADTKPVAKDQKDNKPADEKAKDDKASKPADTANK